MRETAIAALFLAGYAAILVWETWPLGAHLGTHLAATVPPCLGDTHVVVRLGGLRPEQRAEWNRLAVTGRDDLRFVLRDGGELLFVVIDPAVRRML